MRVLTPFAIVAIAITFIWNIGLDWFEASCYTLLTLWYTPGICALFFAGWFDGVLLILGLTLILGAATVATMFGGLYVGCTVLCVGGFVAFLAASDS